MNIKLINEFMGLGCESRKQAAIALQVYSELCEVRKYWDVEYHYNKVLQSLYLTGKPTKLSKTSVFVPVAISDRVSFADMQKFIALDSSDAKSVYLSIVDSDSTCVYYQISDGIAKPVPEVRHISFEERREQHDTDLEKHRAIIEQAAMFGIPVTIPKDTKIYKSDQNS